MPTKIEWCTETWNPITGCSKISEGCQNCYAERMAKRLAGRYGYPAAPNQFRPTFHRDALGKPKHWKKPRHIFVCSMGDLFHAVVDYQWFERIMFEIYKNGQHTYIILTKRPRRAKEFLDYFYHMFDNKLRCPFPNIWIGVTVENQSRADERIQILLQIPAAVRLVSVEPMLGAVDLSKHFNVSGCRIHCPHDYNFCRCHPGECRDAYDNRGINWVICGGESGPGARPLHPDWARSLRDQCVASGTPYFFKQWGKKKAGRILDGQEWNQFPVTK